MVVALPHLIEAHVARDGDGPGARSHGADDEARSLGGGVAQGRLAPQPGSRQGDLMAVGVEPIFSEHIRGTTEGIRRDEIGSRLEVFLVDGPDDIRAREVAMLVAALVLRAPEILGAQVPRLDHGAHGPVEDQDPPLEGLAEKSSALGHLHGLILTCSVHERAASVAGSPSPRGWGFAGRRPRAGAAPRSPKCEREQWRLSPRVGGKLVWP